MAYPHARRNAADVIVGSTEEEAGILRQSLVLDDRQSENGKRWVDPHGCFVDNSVGMYQIHTLSQVAALPPQQVIDLGDGSDSCYDHRKLFANQGSVSPGGYLTASAENSLRRVTSPTGHVSFEGSKSTDTEVFSTVETVQCVRDPRQRGKDKTRGAGCSRKCNFYHDATTELQRRSTLPEILQGNLLRAALALEEEKQSEEFALVAVTYCLDKISSKYSEVRNCAVTLFGDCVTVQNSNDHSSSLDSRLRTVEDYIRTAYAEAFNEVAANVLDGDLKPHEISVASCKTGHETVQSNFAKDAVNFTRGRISCNTSDNYLLTGYMTHSAVLVDLLQFAAEVRNAIVAHHRMLGQLSGIGEVYVCAIEVSCRAVLNTAKSVASVVKTALEATRIAQRMLSCEIQRSRGDPPYIDEVTLPATWTHIALKDAELAVLLHTDATLLLKSARKKLESLKHKEKIALDALHLSNAFEKDLLVYLVQQPRYIDFHELRRRQTELTSMRDMLSAILYVMMGHPSIIFDLVERSSSTVVKVLHVLSFATDSSCSAIESSLDALKKVAQSR